MKSFQSNLFKDKFFLLLIILNLVTSFISFQQASAKRFQDAQGYWLMAEGLGQGRFTAWYDLDEYYPDTLRTPGYPTFLLLLKSIYNSQDFVKYIQYLLYLLSVLICLKILDRLNTSSLAKKVFLVLTAINIQVPYYAGLISSEMLSIFLTVLFIYILVCKPLTVKNAILLGLIGASNFHSRPAFMLFPIGIAIFLVLYSKQNWKYSAVCLLIFFGFLLHFGYWNQQNHGKFKLTPIEGGGGAAHMGYWSFKLPKGYKERFYWDNKMMSDLTDPFSFSDETREANKEEFESEWIEIRDQLGLAMTQEDSALFREMKSMKKGAFLTYRSEISILREELLVEALKNNIKENPIYFFKSRLYSFIRFYYAGINLENLEKAKTLKAKLNVVIPFLITFTFIALGMVISVIYALKNIKKISFPYLILILMILYQGAVHTPFVIKSRYTVPAHLFVLILLSYLFCEYLNWRKKNRAVKA